MTKVHHILLLLAYVGRSNLASAEDTTFVIKKKKASRKAHERRVARVHDDKLPKHNSMKVSGQYSSDVLSQLKSA